MFILTKRFPLGSVVITTGASSRLPRVQVLAALMRHASGDWGDLNEDDWEANNDALEDGDRLRSAYSTQDGTRFWIITEHDRSVTTVLLPDDY